MNDPQANLKKSRETFLFMSLNQDIQGLIFTSRGIFEIPCIRNLIGLTNTELIDVHFFHENWRLDIGYIYQVT